MGRRSLSCSSPATCSTACRSGGAVLVVTRGPNSGSRFVLGPENAAVVTIGRHPESDIFLDDITVSRRHAEVRYDNGAYRAHDIGSLNGTYLNRERIDTRLPRERGRASGGQVPPAVPRSWPRPWCRPCSWHRLIDRGLEGDEVVGRAHLSIGEVLSLLHEEFPDVTISKIRFLESQGLVDPERTPSGYRKFYEPDIERLRWVLRQQRDAFLPLKVIKDRLEEQGDPDADEPGAGEGLVEEGYVRAELATAGALRQRRRSGGDPRPAL